MGQNPASHPAKGTNMLTGNAQTLYQRIRNFRISHAGNLHVIGLQKVSFRIRYPRGPFGIVSQQQHSFAGLIQAPNRGEPWQIIIEFRIYGRTSFLVGSRGDQTTGLIQHQIDFAGGADGAAIHFNAVAPEVHWRFGIAL